MLLGLARWLRFLGFQTWCFQNLNEVSELLQKDPEVIYLTCSKSHIKKIKPTRYFLITEDLIEGQLHKLNDRFQIFRFASLFTLCTICNAAVEEIDKKDIKDRVPQRVHENFNQFWQCPDCQRLYWNGGHIMRLKEKLTRMNIPLPE